MIKSSRSNARVVHFVMLVGALIALSFHSMAFELSEADRSQLADGEVLVRTEGKGKDRHVEAAILIDATPAQTWAVMVDCDAAPEFTPNMKRCEILEEDPEGNWNIIEHEVKYSWLTPKTVYRFRADYIEPEHIRFERVSGDLRRLEGDWYLSPWENDEKVLVTYSVILDPGMLVPNFMARRALRKDLPDVLKALRTRVEIN